MTKENEAVRNKLMYIESVVTRCLHSQPDDDAKCYRHLMDAMDRIRQAACCACSCGFDVEAYDIEWEKDGQDVDLPDSDTMRIRCGDDIADILSARHGYLVKGYSVHFI